MKFRVSEQRFRHSGPTDPYYVEVGTVEAKDAASAPDVFARSKGFDHALRWTDTLFAIGNQRYTLAPAE